MKRPYFYLLLIPALLLASCGPAPCFEQAAEYTPALESYFDEWDDANTVANSTPRAALSQAVADLQAIKRNVDDLAHPECVDTVQLAAVSYMDKTIEGYLSFMAQDEDEVVSKKFEDAAYFLDRFVKELTKLKAGAIPYD